MSELQTEAILDAQLYKIAQMEIQKILDELREKTKEAERIEAILASEKKLWNVVKSELNEIGETFGDRRRTRLGSSEDAPEFDPEAYIVKENTNIVLTRDGWIKRIGRLASVEGTRVREGDEVTGVVPGNTLDHVVFFADDGTAYTMRMNEVPASSGYGEPIVKFFRLDDQVKIVSAWTTDERFVPLQLTPSNGEVPGPYLLVATAQGQVLREPYAPFRTASTRSAGVFAQRAIASSWPGGFGMKRFLWPRPGVIHFKLDRVNVLSGVGRASWASSSARTIPA